MKQLSLLMSILAVLGLTACEKTLDVADDGMSQCIGQVKNSLLQVRTRASGSVSEGATVAYPVTVYVFQGNECRAAQIIGDDGLSAAAIIVASQHHRAHHHSDRYA